MSIECGECEHDLRGGHDPSCSRYKPPEATMSDTERVCPYCGDSYQPEGEDLDPGDREETCESCGETYIARDDFTVTHYAIPMSSNACHHRREWSAAEFPSECMALLCHSTMLCAISLPNFEYPSWFRCDGFAYRPLLVL